MALRTYEIEDTTLCIELLMGYAYERIIRTIMLECFTYLSEKFLHCIIQSSCILGIPPFAGIVILTVDHIARFQPHRELNQWRRLRKFASLPYPGRRILPNQAVLYQTNSSVVAAPKSPAQKE
jgi:hypothetical protein